MSNMSTGPILLFDNECGVCRRIASWVTNAARFGKADLVVRPIGDDPVELRALNPALDIWEAYATIHLLMPDGSMRLGGEAVAEVLRSLRRTHWLTKSLGMRIFGIRPFQALLNFAYLILADVRPLLGCESCGTPSRWVRPIKRSLEWAKRALGETRQPASNPHFTALSTTKRGD